MLKIYISIVSVLLTFQLFSQNITGSKYGTDSASCMANLSSMSEFARIKVYDYALNPWREVFINCPRASKNTYIYGVSIFKNLIEKSTSEIERKQYLDTLILIYDKRMEYFGDEGNVLYRKALDLLQYKYENQKEIYEMLLKSVNILGIKTEPSVFYTTMQLSTLLLSKNELTREAVLENYNTFSALLNQMETNNISGISDIKDKINKLMIGGVFGDCKMTDSIYMAKLNDKNITPDQIAQIVSLLETAKCTEGEAYLKAATIMYNNKPDAQYAIILARLFKKKNEYAKAVEYYNFAIKQDDNNENKATWYYEMAAIEYVYLNQNTKAKEHALKAAELKQNWGQPYLLIGSMYASSSQNCGGNDLEKSSIFWAAVDKYNYAKSIDPTVLNEANENITKYSAYFPNNETIFFYGYKEGDPYTVKCWINESTKVRAR